MKIRSRYKIFGLAMILIIAWTSFLLSDQGGVEEHILPNGLRVLLKEVHTSPIVSVWSWYGVGSRNEAPGTTGLAHFLEHMNFKGTEGISRKELTGMIDAMGGYWNGYTWIDQTTYFETLPSSGLELALRLEAERMQRSLLDPQEFEKERTVVISELQGGESDPKEVLDIEVTAAAFKAHPYGWPTIGWLSDLETVTRTDLLNLYSTYYIPNNATIVVVGDFETKYALEKVREYFMEIPVGPTPSGLRTLEPEQFGERRVVVRKRGPASYLRVAYHTPPVSDEDFIPLMVLDALLAGGESTNLWDLDWYEDASRSSRLYRALIDKGLASSAGVLLIPTKYPWLFYLYATAIDGVSPDLLERAILEEVEKLKMEPPEKRELNRAKNQLLARYVYDSDSVTEQAHQLGFFATVHHYKYALEFPDLVEDVTAQEVMEVARKYMTPENRTVGWFIPNDEERVSAEPKRSEGLGRSSRIATLRVEGYHPSPISDFEKFVIPDFSRIEPVRKVLDNGLVVMALRNPIGPSIHLKVTLRAGSVTDPVGKAGLSTLTSRYLLEGAGDLGGEQLAEKFEVNGTEIRVNVNYDYTSVDLELLSKEFEDVVELVADVVVKPQFPEEALERLKKEIMTEIREGEKNEHTVSLQAMREMIFTKDHPYGRRVLGYKEELAGLDTNDVGAYHREHYYPANVSIVIVGDLDPEKSIKTVEKGFGDWEGSVEPIAYILPSVEGADKPRIKVVSMEEKSQVSLSLGHVGIRRDNPDYASVQLMNNILGRFGLGGRLGGIVREEKGYAYFIFSSFNGGIGQFPFFILGGITPEVIEETVEIVVGEVGKMAREGPTAEELEKSKRNILGLLALELEENQGIADMLSEMELYSLGTSYLEEYSREISDARLEDVRRAAREYLDPDGYSMGLAGPIDEDLKVLRLGEK
jgi:zinc protease